MENSNLFDCFPVSHPKDRVALMTNKNLNIIAHIFVKIMNFVIGSIFFWNMYLDYDLRANYHPDNVIIQNMSFLEFQFQQNILSVIIVGAVFIIIIFGNKSVVFSSILLIFNICLLMLIIISFFNYYNSFIFNLFTFCIIAIVINLIYLGPRLREELRMYYAKRE